MTRLVLKLIIVMSIFGCDVVDPISAGFPSPLPEKVDFNFHVKPILSDRCFACHGPDDEARKAGLRLDNKESAFRLLDSLRKTYTLYPGKPKKSELYQRISSKQADFMMPPPESNLHLSGYEIELIKRWIEQGAEWKPHWAFILPQKGEMPRVAKTDWPENPIDYYILARLEKEKRKPSARASKEKLIRRLFFDLTGLPPSPEEIDSFLLDQSEGAYEQLVDQLLTSEAYGERMTTEWMDLARYAETNGYHHDFERNMWPWRDWVIAAFNQNMPHDQFVTWQLAGDLLPEPSYEQKLATAFNRNNRTTQECGSIDEEFRVSYVVDRTNTFGRAFLGLTVECAQCHDHKYDPVSQKEYFQLFAFFNQVPEKGVTRSFQGQSAPYLELPNEQVEEIRKYIDEMIEQEYAEGSTQDHDNSYLPNWKEEMETMLQPVMIMQDRDTLRPTYILQRGLYDSPGLEVSAGTPESILPFTDDMPPNRLGLAKWLFEPEHPLTARVVVNRYWQMIFGRGLVNTPEDFGNQGALPSHPALLDWLAVELVESGWDIKHLLKLVVMSSTYRQTSKTEEEHFAFDPDNQWLARGPQQRLTAEMLRDQALMVSGLMNSKVGGPSVKPYQPEHLWTQVSSGGRYKRKYMNAHGPDLYRRSLYTYWKRIQPPPAMLIFDAANRNQCTVKRQSTNTPLQALVLLNDPQFVEPSRAFAERMIREGGEDLEQRLVYAFRWATSRSPDPEETAILADLFKYELEEFEKHPEQAKQFLEIGEYRQSENYEPATLAAYAVVASTLLNMSESMQKN